MLLDREYAASTAAALGRFAMSTTFLLSSIPKLRQPYDFLFSVYDYELLGPATGLWVATYLPWLEFVLAVLLLADVFRRSSIVFALGLSGLFVFAQSSALARGLKISCGCFSVSSPGQVSYGSLLVSTSFLVLCLACVMIEFRFPPQLFRERTIRRTVVNQ